MVLEPGDYFILTKYIEEMEANNPGDANGFDEVRKFFKSCNDKREDKFILQAKIVDGNSVGAEIVVDLTGEGTLLGQKFLIRLNRVEIDTVSKGLVEWLSSSSKSKSKSKSPFGS